MLTIRTAAHIRGARNVKGLRACNASTGARVAGLDARRRLGADVGSCDRELRRGWLAGLWEAHQARVRVQRGD